MQEMESIILLAYQNRSGSSFLFEQLSKYANVCVCLEAEVLIYELLMHPFDHFTKIGFEKVLDWSANDPKFIHWNLGSEELKGLLNVKTNFDAFVFILKAYKNKVLPEANAIAFKGTKVIDFLRTYPKLIQASKFITVGLVRDPRGIFNSQKGNIDSIGRLPFAQSAVSFSLSWNRYIKKMTEIEAKYEMKIIKYEDFIANTEVQNVWGHPITISFRAEGNYYKRIPESQKHLHKLVPLEPKPLRINAWQNELDEKDLFTIDFFTKEFRSLFSYENSKVNLSIRVFYYLITESIKFILNAVFHKICSLFRKMF